MYPQQPGAVSEQSSEAMFVSVVTLGEIRQGIEQLRRRDAAQSRVLEQWLNDLGRAYADRVIGIDRQVADEWGRLRAGRTLPVIDGLLAATARVHALTLVPRNEKDFAGLAVKILNPR